MRVQGDIAPACTLTDAGGAGTTALTVDMRAGDITRPGTREFGFTVDCNAPFQYRLEALHGALAFQTDRSPPAGFSARIPYDVAVHIPTSGAPIDDRCNGADLRAGEVRCTFSNSGNEIAQGKSGKLTFAWAPKENPVAGNYHERLTVYISIKQ